MSSLSLLLRQLLYFSVLFFSCQSAWAIFHTLSKNINIRTSSTVFRLDFPLSGTVAKSSFCSIHFSHGYKNTLFVNFVMSYCWELLLNRSASDFQSHWAFLSFCFPRYSPPPSTFFSPFFGYGLQSIYVDFMLLIVCGKTYFDWMGTYLSPFNSVANPFYLILSAIILRLLLGHCWKYWLMLRTVPVTGLSWSSPLKRLFYNGNSPVPATFWGGF